MFFRWNLATGFTRALRKILRTKNLGIAALTILYHWGNAFSDPGWWYRLHYVLLYISRSLSNMISLLSSFSQIIKKKLCLTAASQHSDWPLYISVSQTQTDKLKQGRSRRKLSNASPRSANTHTHSSCLAGLSLINTPQAALLIHQLSPLLIFNTRNTHTPLLIDSFKWTIYHMQPPSDIKGKGLWEAITMQVIFQWVCVLNLKSPHSVISLLVSRQCGLWLRHPMTGKTHPWNISSL